MYNICNIVYKLNTSLRDTPVAVIYPPPPIPVGLPGIRFVRLESGLSDRNPVGLRLFQKVRSDSGRTNWNPVESGGFQWIPVRFQSD